MSFAARIRELAGDRPGELAYRHLGVDGAEPAFTWSWLDRRSSQLAGALAERGVGAGDRLSIGIRNSPPLVLAALAAWKLGAVPVPLRWDLPDWEHGRLREVVAAPVHLGPDDVAWIEATEDRPVPDPDEAAAAISPRTYGICSSGSTGTPKVILSAWPAIWDAAIGVPFVEPWRAVPRPQTILVPAPMYHTNGFATLLNLLAGDHLVIMERFDAARLVDAVERHRITTFTATPTMLQRIADLPGIEKRDLSSLEWILQGAAPMPPSLVHRWAGLIGAERILMVYGMTEALGFAALRGDEWMTHQGSVGRGVRDTTFRILDADGKELPTGEIGEIYLRSPTGDGFAYLGDAQPPPATADGFRTVGDMGYLDDDGYLYLVDRRVDMIVTGGANVFPAEVEAALVDHPGVADVVVVGLRDPQWGRRVHAIVEPADPTAPPTTDELVAYAKGRLAAYKVPKTVELVEAIPRSEATKVNRRALVDARGG